MKGILLLLLTPMIFLFSPDANSFPFSSPRFTYAVFVGEAPLKNVVNKFQITRREYEDLKGTARPREINCSLRTGDAIVETSLQIGKVAAYNGDSAVEGPYHWNDHKEFQVAARSEKGTVYLLSRTKYEELCKNVPSLPSFDAVKKIKVEFFPSGNQPEIDPADDEFFCMNLER